MGKKDQTEQRILSYLSLNPAASRAALDSALGIPPSTVRRHVAALVADGRVTEGLSLSAKALSRKEKAFIGIYAYYPYDRKMDAMSSSDKEERRQAKLDIRNYQHKIVEYIRRQLASKRFIGQLTLVSLDIVLGADWDILLVVTASDKTAVGDFVTGPLRGHPHISNSRTTFAYSRGRGPVDGKKRSGASTPNSAQRGDNDGLPGNT